jgi:zinc transport system ATP-binding protein
MTILVELIGICKYFGKNLILDNISFSLNKGEIITLVGQNGAGKTTIAKILLGLEKYNSGSLYIKSGLKIGYVPQVLGMNYTVPMTAGYLFKLLINSFDYDKAILASYFPEFESLQGRDISCLSGGQLQKLFLISIILTKADLIILDEPIQSLDINSQQEFYSLVRRIKADFNVTIFMISHDLFTVMKHSDQVICLNKRVCCTGKPKEIANNIEMQNALSEIGFYLHHHNF